MISSQIALKPFIGRLAAREGTDYDGLINGQAQEMAAVTNPDEFLQDAHLKSALSLTSAVRVAPADTQEIQGTLSSAGVDARLSQAFTSNLAVMAMALDPICSLGLDGAMRMLMTGEKALPESAVVNGELKLQPALEFTAKAMDTDANGLVTMLAEEYKAHPEMKENEKARADAALKTASLFRVDSSEMQGLESKLAAQGLNAEQTQYAVSGLVMNAIGMEPTFRGALDSMFALAYRGEKPMAESSIVPA